MLPRSSGLFVALWAALSSMACHSTAASSSTPSAVSNPTAVSTPTAVSNPTAVSTLPSSSKTPSAQSASSVAAGPSDRDCGLHVDSSDAFETLDWLSLQEKIVENAATDWGIEPPTDAADARKKSCFESSGSSSEPPTLGNHCEGNDPWRVTTTHGYFVDTTYFIWPQADERAVVLAMMVGGSMCSLSQNTSLNGVTAARHLNFLVVDELTTSFEWNETASSCERASEERAVFVFDDRLGRGFLISGITPETPIDYLPTEHALVATGPTCRRRLSLDRASR